MDISAYAVDLPTLKQRSILRDNGKSTSEIHKSNGTCVQPVDGDVAFCSFDNAEKGECQAALSSTSATYDTNLLMRIDGQIYVPQYQIKAWSISSREILKRYCSLRGPTDGWTFLRNDLWCFAGEGSIIQNSLNRNYVCLYTIVSLLASLLDAR